MITIPFSNLMRQYQEIRSDVLSAIQSVLESCDYIMGSDVQFFEEEFADYCKTKHAIAVGNGTDAISIGLRAIGVRPGDYVITAANTFIATTEAISAIGAKIALVDVKPDTLLIDPQLVENRVIELKALKRNVVAIIPVHLYGNYCDMRALRIIADRFNLKILEDASQAHGAELDGIRPGTWGDLATFSFYPSKNIGAYGDAGSIITNSDEIAENVKMLRNHGRRPGEKYDHHIEGYNSRMDSLQAAILRVKLRHIDRWTENRIRSANIYSELLTHSPVKPVGKQANVKHVYHLFVVQTDQRDLIQNSLQSKSIHTGIHYPTPIHKLAAYRLNENFPNVESASGKILSLPIDGTITEDEVKQVSSAIMSLF